MGVLLGSAVVPIALCVTWSKASKVGCIAGAVSGLVAGIIAWLVTTSQLNGEINVVVCTFSYPFNSFSDPDFPFYSFSSCRPLVETM
jgi:Na+/proline symporter